MEESKKKICEKETKVLTSTENHVIKESTINIWKSNDLKSKIKRAYIGFVLRYIKPDNVRTTKLSNIYEIRENSKYFQIPHGYFWHAVAVGYLLKLIKVITKNTKEN